MFLLYQPVSSYLYCSIFPYVFFLVQQSSLFCCFVSVFFFCSPPPVIALLCYIFSNFLGWDLLKYNMWITNFLVRYPRVPSNSIPLLSELPQVLPHCSTSSSVPDFLGLKEGWIINFRFSHLCISTQMTILVLGFFWTFLCILARCPSLSPWVCICQRQKAARTQSAKRCLPHHKCRDYSHIKWQVNHKIILKSRDPFIPVASSAMLADLLYVVPIICTHY